MLPKLAKKIKCAPAVLDSFVRFQQTFIVCVFILNRSVFSSLPSLIENLNWLVQTYEQLKKDIIVDF